MRCSSTLFWKLRNLSAEGQLEVAAAAAAAAVVAADLGLDQDSGLDQVLG